MYDRRAAEWSAACSDCRRRLRMFWPIVRTFSSCRRHLLILLSVCLGPKIPIGVFVLFCLRKHPCAIVKFNAVHAFGRWRNKHRQRKFTKQTAAGCDSKPRKEIAGGRQRVHGIYCRLFAVCDMLMMSCRFRPVPQGPLRPPCDESIFFSFEKVCFRPFGFLARVGRTYGNPPHTHTHTKL